MRPKLSLLWLLPCLIAPAGCSDKKIIPLLGRWEGGFTAEQIAGAQPKDIKRFDLKGYLMLYATEYRFKMHLEGEQEAVDLSGSWAPKGAQVILTPKDESIDDYGGADVRNPNKRFIPIPLVKQAYSSPIVLNVAAGNKKLSGPLFSIGQLSGRHEFARS
jgi:hypothetical protein